MIKRLKRAWLAFWSDEEWESLSSGFPGMHMRDEICNRYNTLIHGYHMIGEQHQAKVVLDMMKEHILGDLIRQQEEARRKEIEDAMEPAKNNNKAGRL